MIVRKYKLMRDEKRIASLVSFSCAPLTNILANKFLRPPPPKENHNQDPPLG